jgi:hypothetical protein
MNIADYLSELLGEHDEVSLPGLGYFVRTRVNAYYDDKEAKFYPPYHQVKFVPEPKDDDTFARYIAEKKNISLASSKYFAEKFVSKLKEEATTGKYLFADLGIFYTDQDQLVFKPNDKIASDPAFCGYPPVAVTKLGQPFSREHAKPVFDRPVSTPAVSAPQAQTIPPEEYYEEEPETTRPVNVWPITLLALTIIALALFGVYQFAPSAFDKISLAYHRIIGKKEDTTAQANAQATNAANAKQAMPVKDTAAKTNVQIIDTTKLQHFEVIAHHFAKWQKAKAEAQVERYKSMGLDAKISTDVPGPFLKISVGTYFTLHEADSARSALIKSGKISYRAEKTVQINPKK